LYDSDFSISRSFANVDSLNSRALPCRNASEQARIEASFGRIEALNSTELLAGSVLFREVTTNSRLIRMSLTVLPSGGKQAPMSTIEPEFDLLRLDSNESVGGVWIGTANSLREAVETIRILAATRPGQYMVYSQVAGSKAIYQATNDNVTPLNRAARAATHG
jgi:hypothetical protein